MLFLLLWGNCISLLFLRSIIVHVNLYRELVWETCNSVWWYRYELPHTHTILTHTHNCMCTRHPSREFQPPVVTFLSCAYRLGGAAACLFWLPVLSHYHRQIHPLAWGTPSVWHHRRSSCLSLRLRLGCSFRLSPANHNRSGQAIRGPPFQDCGYHHRILSNPDYCMTSRLQWLDGEATPPAEGRPHVPCRWKLGPKLCRWSCWGFAVHGRRTWKPHQPN